MSSPFWVILHWERKITLFGGADASWISRVVLPICTAWVRRFGAELVKQSARMGLHRVFADE